MSLVKILTADSQNNRTIFKLIKNFYILLNDDNWIKKYIFWELELFKNLGYHLEFKDLVDKKIIGNQLQYVSKSANEKKIIPSFLIEKTSNFEEMAVLLDGLKLVGDFLDKTILKPNNITQPKSRLQFINTLK
mgnify:FL=1